MTTWLNMPFQTQFRVIDGLTVRYAVSGARGGPAALLLSPWPESLLAFEPAWPLLAESAFLVAVDLPGFGHSQRRAALLSPRAMGEFVVTIADAFALERPHVVAPGVNTAAALFAAARNPGRFLSLVVGGGPAAVPLQLGGVLKDWAAAPSAAGFRGTDSRPLVAAVLRGITRYQLPDPVRDDYLSAYQGDRMAESMRYLRAHAGDLPMLSGLLTQVDTPVQVIAGARDGMVPLGNAEFLRQRLPRGRLAVIDAGHFAWEDAAAEYAALVTGWWRGGFEGGGPGSCRR